MRARHAFVLLVVITMAAFVGLGCAGPARPNRLTQTGEAARTVLILPMNVVLEYPAEIAVSPKPVWEDLVAYVKAHDKRVVTLPPADARRLWIESAKEAMAQTPKSGKTKGGARGFDAAGGILARKLAGIAEFDLLVVPSVFAQNASGNLKSAKWDGVSRPIHFAGPNFDLGSITYEEEFHGRMRAASLHVAVFDPTGRELQVHQAGIDLLVYVERRSRDPSDTGKSVTLSEGRWTLQSVADPFENDEFVHDAVERVLQPLLLPIPSV